MLLLMWIWFAFCYRELIKCLVNCIVQKQKYSKAHLNNSLKNENSVIIYSPSCCSEPEWLSFFCGTWELFLSMGTKTTFNTTDFHCTEEKCKILIWCSTKERKYILFIEYKDFEYKSKTSGFYPHLVVKRYMTIQWIIVSVLLNSDFILTPTVANVVQD